MERIVSYHFFMRRALPFIFALLLFVVLSVVASLYFLRDDLLLRELRHYTGNGITVGALHTELNTGVILELNDVTSHEGGANYTLRAARIETPLGLPALFSAWRHKSEIPLVITLSGAHIEIPPASPGKSASSMAWPREMALPFSSPVPAQVTLNVVEGEFRGNKTLIRALTAKIEARVRENGIEASLNASAATPFPLNLTAKAVASRTALKLQSFTFRAAGIEGSATGELTLSPVAGKFHLTGGASDLARVSFRPEDRVALGLTAQPSGALNLGLEGTLGANGDLTVNGALRVESISLPLHAPEKTAFASLADGKRIEGTALFNASIPFSAAVSYPFGAHAARVTAENAHLDFDLTGAEVETEGTLRKPRGIPLRGDASFSWHNGAAEISALHFTLHTLNVAANATLPAPLGNSIQSSFHMSVTSLAGFPAMLPALHTTPGAALSDARGAIIADGTVNAIANAPSSAAIAFKTFQIRDLILPLAYQSDAFVARGTLKGSATAAGSYNAGDANISQSHGNFDLTSLDLKVPGKFEKKAGKKLTFSFDAKGTPSRLQVTRIAVGADGLSASLAGTAAFDPKRNARLALTAAARAELSALRAYLPAWPAKISDGSLETKLKIGGIWFPAGGLEKSPLALNGTIAAKLQSVEIPATVNPPPTRPQSTPLFPPWPAAHNAEIGFSLEVSELKHGPLAAEGIKAHGSLRKGAFTANATVGNIFGGKARIDGLSGSLLGVKIPVRGIATVEGLDLSPMASFVDPAYGKIVKGTLKADTRFSIPDALGPSLLNTSTAEGSAQIHNAYLSTATFDSLVNEKLKEIPGVGDRAKISSGGLAAEINTAYRASGGQISFSHFVATTPKKDEMRLTGTVNLAFDCDLSGEAHLASAPVGGAVREANSDSEGRFVVPVHFHGNLKAPEADIAASSIQTILQKTATHEATVLQDKAINAAKSKAQDALKGAARGLLNQLKNGFSP